MQLARNIEAVSCVRAGVRYLRARHESISAGMERRSSWLFDYSAPSACEQMAPGCGRQPGLDILTLWWSVRVRSSARRSCWPTHGRASRSMRAACVSISPDCANRSAERTAAAPLPTCPARGSFVEPTTRSATGKQPASSKRAPGSYPVLPRTGTDGPPRQTAANIGILERSGFVMSMAPVALENVRRTSVAMPSSQPLRRRRSLP